MAIDVRPTAAERGWKPYLLTVEQFLKMIGSGVFPDDARAELLGGVLVERKTRYAPHNYCVIQLGRLLNRAVPAEWLVVEEKPLELGRRWRPEPDLSILKGPVEAYRDRTPGPTDVGLLIEVSDSSHRLDRGFKWKGYAAARVPLYWIVDIPGRRVEIYRDPGGRGRSASYRHSEVFGIDAEVPIVLDGREVGRLAARDFLP